MSELESKSIPNLSICITTLNRAAFIGSTLDSILSQVTQLCEVVVLDSASIDRTAEIVLEYVRRGDRVRYFRQEANGGIDQDYDKAVQLARGEYCWLMTDDDLLMPGAVNAVLGALTLGPALVIANVESRDFSMETVLQKRWLDYYEDRVYQTEELDRLFFDLGDTLKFIGCVVVKRELWMSRYRKRFYGSLYIHIGVIFQARLPQVAIVIAEPCVAYRWGNTHTWSSKLFETLMINLPDLVWSLEISESAKRSLCSERPWQSWPELLYCRARGCYSWVEYRRWVRPKLRSLMEGLTPAIVALIPGFLVNAVFIIYYSTTGRLYRRMWTSAVVRHAMRASPFHIANWLYGVRQKKL